MGRSSARENEELVARPIEEQLRTLAGIEHVYSQSNEGYVFMSIDFDANVEHTLALLQRAHEERHALVVFPEMGLCGYTVRDLVLDHHLLESCEQALSRLLDASRENDITYYLEDSAGFCFVWGHDVAYYAARGCTEMM